MVTAPVELTVTRLTPALDWRSRMSAAVPLVAFTVMPTTPLAVGVTVFCAVVPGTCCRQVAHPPVEDHVGRALAPLEINTWPAVPAPRFWKAPVAVVPPARMPYAVVDDTPVPP